MQLGEATTNALILGEMVHYLIGNEFSQSNVRLRRIYAFRGHQFRTGGPTIEFYNQLPWAHPGSARSIVYCYRPIRRLPITPAAKTPVPINAKSHRL